MNLIEISPFRPGSCESSRSLSIALPCSKSLALRALMYATLAEGQSTLRGVTISDDLQDFLGALEAFGVQVDVSLPNVSVQGTSGNFKPGDCQVDLTLSGVTARMVTVMAALRRGATTIDGAAPLRKRPLKGIVDGLQQLGVAIEGDKLPLVVSGAGLSSFQKNLIVLDGSVSSQFFTALLAIAPFVPGGLTVEVAGDLVSKPYLDLTMEVMRAFGVPVVHQDYRSFSVAPATYNATDFNLEADASAASYFMALATLHGISIMLPGLRESSAQGDLRFLQICQRLGAQYQYTAEGLEVVGPRDGQLNPLPEAIDLESMPDVAQTLFAMAPFVPGGLKIKGLKTLRVKECDRIGCPQAEFLKIGLEFMTGKDWVEIAPIIPKEINRGVECLTYNDHRMAMSLAVLGSRLPRSISIMNPSCVTKTFPHFWSQFEKVWKHVGA